MHTSLAGEKLIRVLAFTLVLSVMNGSMFNIALPTIGEQFRLPTSQVSWVVTAYILVYAIGSVIYGKLADRYRLKDLLTIGLLLFAAGSLLGFAATEYWMIVAGRILQSAGSSVIPATSMIIPIRYFPPETRGRAMGVTSTGLALGLALGPVAGGVITSMASWRYLFLLSVLAVFTLPFYRKYLDDIKGQAKKTDLLGGSILAVTISVLLLGITNGSWVLFAAGIASLALFVIYIHRVEEPFIPPSIFRYKPYTVSVLVSFMASGFSFGIPFLLPLMLTRLNGLSPAVVGFVMFPGAMVASLLSRTGGKLADRKGNVFLVLIASSFQLASFLLLSVTAGIQPLVVSIFLVFSSLGAAFLGIGVNNTVSRTLPKELTGAGMGLLSMFNFMAGAAATSVIGAMLDKYATAPPMMKLRVMPAAGIYSNIFLTLSLLVLLLVTLYYMQFRQKQKYAG